MSFCKKTFFVIEFVLITTFFNLKSIGEGFCYILYRWSLSVGSIPLLGKRGPMKGLTKVNRQTPFFYIRVFCFDSFSDVHELCRIRSLTLNNNSQSAHDTNSLHPPGIKFFCNRHLERCITAVYRIPV